MSLESLNTLLEFFANVTAVLGIPIGLVLFYQAKRKEQKDREYGTYNALDQNYIDFLHLCLENPDLDIFDIPREAELPPLTPEQYRRQITIYVILISMFERAYLMYKDQSTAIKRDQWSGWEGYMRDWLSRPSFRKDWAYLTSQFDENFVAFMNKLAEKTSLPAVDVRSKSNAD
jgi:hypothetical protein